MNIPAFSIGEWLVCNGCGSICDAPFHPPGSEAEDSELVLGNMLPESYEPLANEWQLEVEAKCPSCGLRLQAQAVFHGRIFYAFVPAGTA